MMKVRMGLFTSSQYQKNEKAVRANTVSSSAGGPSSPRRAFFEVLRFAANLRPGFWGPLDETLPVKMKAERRALRPPGGSSIPSVGSKAGGYWQLRTTDPCILVKALDHWKFSLVVITSIVPFASTMNPPSINI
jgi:hypothetical protein